jgi:alkylhydroperoxidase family enzyme
MLRASAIATSRRVDLRALTNPRVDSLLPGGAELLRFVDAALDGDDVDLADARNAVRRSAGDAAVVDAAGVIANFEMMNRVADATGMPVGKGSRERMADIIEELGLERFDHGE